MDSPEHIQTLGEWRRKNTSLFFKYLSRALYSNLKVPVSKENGEQELKVISAKTAMTNMPLLKPYMFPPEFTDRTEARKSFKKYGHWKKVDYNWVDITKITIPDSYEESEECDEVCRFWKKLLDSDVPIPAIRVYSDEDLSMISDGVQRVKVLKEAGYKYVLVYFRYETNDDPPA